MSVDTPIWAVGTHPDALSNFCRRVLARIPRADQRRWGELYVRGLIGLPGRKSLRQIAALTADDGAEQALQQFVNQSPWDWRPVRADLANYASSSLQPQTWVVPDFALPKNGSASVGVDRQYAHSLGRVINCQTGVSLFLSDGKAAIPVDWRLSLPSSWDTDPERRERAHLPEYERHRSRWEYVISMIDEALSWGVSAAPVSLDYSHDLHTDRLIRALERRSLSYLVRVGPGARVAAGPAPGDPALTAGVAAAQALHGGEGTVLRTAGTGYGTIGSSFILRRLPAMTSVRRLQVPARNLLVESRPGRRAGGLWLTNLVGLSVAQQVGLTRLVARAGTEMERVQNCFGLGHFEGRSFRGWHHHATLVSLAQAFMVDQGMPAQCIAI